MDLYRKRRLILMGVWAGQVALWWLLILIASSSFWAGLIAGFMLATVIATFPTVLGCFALCFVEGTSFLDYFFD